MNDIEILTVVVKFTPPTDGEWSASAYEATTTRGKERKFYYAPTPEIVLAKVLAALMEHTARRKP